MVSTRRKQTRVYRVGDKVEVVRGDGITIGTLVSSKQASPRSSPLLWKVTILEKEEEISERLLGRVLTPEQVTSSLISSGSDETSVQTTPLVAPSTPSQPKTKAAKKNKKTKPKSASARRKAELKSKGLTTRHGLEVKKITMKTGILFIYVANRRAEFVRTK